jgi:hypothetical protein
MADIKDQLIKDSYNYVLQSDLSTGVVYRIGGSIPVNPIFQSGITINDSFTYSNGTEQNGYALLTDGTGYAYWGPVSGASPSSGVTSISVGDGLSANSSTGAVTIVFTGSTGLSGDYLPLSGGTVTGNTIFQSGLTATTISATTYQNLPFSGTVTGGGTTNYVPKWTGSTGLGNSQIFDNGTNVGIGTTSPSAKLDVNITGGTIGVRISGDSSSDMLRITQTGSGNAILVEDSSNPDSTPFVVTSGGTVGIGTTSPSYFLEAVSTGGVDAVMMFDGGTAANANLIARADTTIKLPVIVMSDRNNNYGINTSFFIGLDRASGASWSTFYSSRNDAIYVNNYTDKGHHFVTANSIGTKSIKMSILGSGNVGIGTSSPSSTLHVSGNTLISSGLTATTISATTYNNLPVSGLTEGNGISVTGNSGNFTISYTGSTGISGNYLPISGGTVTGATNFTNGLSANTISATTYDNLPPIYQLTGGTYSSGTIDFKNTTGGTSFSVTGLSKYFITGSTPTGVTLVNGDRWFDTNSGIELVWITDVDGSQWIQPTQGGGGGVSGDYLPLSGGTVTGSTNFTAGLTSNTISATTYQNLPVSGLTGSSGISVTGNSNGNFTISYTGSTGASGDFLPLSGGTVTGNTTFSAGVVLNALNSSEEINNIVADSSGNLYTYTDGVTISAGSDPAVNSGMFKTNRTVDIGGTLYRVYNIKGNVSIPGGGNNFVNYIGVVAGSTNYTLSTTKSLVVAQDPTFFRVQTPLTTYSLVYDETLLFASPVDLMTINYDNTLGNPDEYYIFTIAANTNNFSCDLQVDYEFLVLDTDVITFTN